VLYFVTRADLVATHDCTDAVGGSGSTGCCWWSPPTSPSRRRAWRSRSGSYSRVHLAQRRVRGTPPRRRRRMCRQQLHPGPAESGRIGRQLGARSREDEIGAFSRQMQHHIDRRRVGRRRLLPGARDISINECGRAALAHAGHSRVAVVLVQNVPQVDPVPPRAQEVPQRPAAGRTAGARAGGTGPENATVLWLGSRRRRPQRCRAPECAPSDGDPVVSAEDAARARVPASPGERRAKEEEDRAAIFAAQPKDRGVLE
jgi:hypothetical protein